MVNTPQPCAFMSYAHFDDTNDGGYLTQLREQLSKEVQAISGQAFPIFQDRQDIEWGQQWRERIETSLDSATLLIPIITPSYLLSDACRTEFKHFLTHEAELNRKELILPIYYITCPELESPNSYEEVIAEIKQRQYRDWRKLRGAAFSTKRVRGTLNSLAERINTIIKSVGSTAEEALWGLIRHGQHLIWNKMYAEALSVFERTLTLDLQYAPGWHGKGVALQCLKRDEEALAAYDRAIMLDPFYDVSWDSRGDLLYKLGRYEEALVDYNAVIPKHAQDWNRRGNALRALTRDEEALAAYTRANILEPTYVRAWTNRIDLLNELGRHTEAHQVAQQRKAELELYGYSGI